MQNVVSGDFGCATNRYEQLDIDRSNDASLVCGVKCPRLKGHWSNLTQAEGHLTLYRSIVVSASEVDDVGLTTGHDQTFD